MFGLNPVKMTARNSASSWTGNRKTLQISPTKSANSQGAEEGDVVGGGREKTRTYQSHIREKKKSDHKKTEVLDLTNNTDCLPHYAGLWYYDGLMMLLRNVFLSLSVYSNAIPY